MLLDFSATYDTMEHSNMLKRLASRYGFSDTVLKWFSSYLFNRTHSVKVQDALSAPHIRSHGTPFVHSVQCSIERCHHSARLTCNDVR